MPKGCLEREGVVAAPSDVSVITRPVWRACIRKMSGGKIIGFRHGIMFPVVTKYRKVGRWNNTFEPEAIYQA